MFKIISFLFYYLHKRLIVMCKIYHTSNPLTLRWRWSHWKTEYERRHQKKRGSLINREKIKN